MTARPPLLAAAAIVAIVSAYLMGRASAPTRETITTQVIRTQRTEYRERTDAASSTTANTITVTGPVVTRWRTAPATRPECPAVVEVERTEGPREERKETTSDLHVAVAKENLATATEAAQSTKIAEHRRPTWAFGLDGGLRFSDASVLVRGRFEVRPLGPFWVSMWGERQAAGLGLRVEW